MTYLTPKSPPWKDESNPFGPPKNSATATPLSAEALQDLENRIENGLESVANLAQSVLEAWSGVSKGLWSNAVIYHPGDIVVYNGNGYSSLTDNNVGNEPDTHPTDWLLILSLPSNVVTAPTGSTSPPEIWAPMPTGGDDTGMLNALLSRANVRFPPAIYTINGVLSFPIEYSQIGSGGQSTIFRLGASGQIQINDLAGTGSVGGKTAGFSIDGQLVQNVTGGGFYVSAGNSRTYEDIRCTRCLGDGTVIWATQNNVFINLYTQGHGGSALVFDNGTGGNRFFGGEFGGSGVHGVAFQQTVPSTGGYPTFLGPCDNKFYGCIIEYAGSTDVVAAQTGTFTSTTQAQVYNGAGGQNDFYGCSINLQSGGGVTVPANTPVVKVENAANAVITSATLTSGSDVITLAVADDQIYPLMTVSHPDIAPGAIVLAVNGTSVTLSSAPTASVTDATVGFGADSSQVTFTDPFILGSSSTDGIGFDLGGQTEICINGKFTVQGCATTFQMWSTATVHMNATVYAVNNGTAWATQNANDPNTGATLNISRASVAGEISVFPSSSVSKGLSHQRSGDALPYLTLGYSTSQNFTGGIIGFGQGNAGEVPFGLGKDPTDNTYVLSGIAESFFVSNRVGGFAGFTSWARFMGIMNVDGPPYGITANKGDWVLDPAGNTWLCSTAGTGTGTGAAVWVSPNILTDPYHVVGGTDSLGTTFNAPWASEVNVRPMVFYKDPFGLVHLEGFIINSAATTGASTVFTLPSGYIPSYGAPSITWSLYGTAYALAGIVGLDGTVQISGAANSGTLLGINATFRI